MTKVRIGYDGGDCIIVAGVPYSKVTSPVQPTSGAVNASPTTINISSYFWRYDDIGVEWGGNHNPWTPCEMGISHYIPANVSTVAVVPANVWYTLYNAPSAGTLRTYIGDVNGTISWKVNGTVVFTKTDWTGDRGMYYFASIALQLALGDVVSCRTDRADASGAYGYFLPNVYP